MNAHETLLLVALIEILDDLVTLAGQDDIEWADDIRRKIHALRALAEAGQ